MTKTLPPLTICLSLNALASTCALAADAANETEVDTVLITAQRADRISRGATGLNLDIKDTPQSISVVTSSLMQDFGANSLNEALRLATGISVEEWETNRTNYLARGFEIKNTQIDGVGLPNDWGIVTGAMDSFGYEKLEVIRGANGLLHRRAATPPARSTMFASAPPTTNKARSPWKADRGMASAWRPTTPPR